MMWLKILQFNITSLVSQARRIELQKILQASNCSFAFIQETHFSNRHRIQIQNYHTLRNDNHQGVALLIKNNIEYELVDYHSTNFPSLFVTIKLKIDNSPKTLLLGSVYFPTNTPPAQFTSELNAIEALSNRFDGSIIGGDLNARSTNWGDHTHNLNGKTLESWLQNFNPSLANFTSDTPTFPRGPSFLDHFLISSHLINHFNKNFSLKTLPTFTDHCPLLLCISIGEANICLREEHSLRSFKNTNWQSFRNQLDSNLLQLFPPATSCLPNTDIDKYISHFNQTLITTLERNSTSSSISFNKYKNLPPEIENLYKVKHQWQRRLKNIFHRSLNRISPAYRELSSQIALLNNIVKQKVNIWLNKELSDRLSKIKPGPWAFKEAFGILGKKKKFHCNKVVVNNETFTSEAKIVESFEKHFTDVYKERVPLFNINTTQRAQESANSVALNIPEHIFLFNSENSALNPIAPHIFTDPDSVKNLLKLLRPKKSSGPDNISNYFLKKISNQAVNFLTILYNNCINNAYFPSLWKTARILPIVKKQNNFDINNYRPISLLSNTGKILERIILNKMNCPLDNPIDPIPDSQFGFRRGHSTLHALTKFQNDIILNLREKRCTVACSLDVEKAFDSVWRVGLISKLASINLPSYIYNILHSFLSNRTFFVQIQGTKSNPRSCDSGVPQGSILGPHLYNIFMHDFPHIWSENNLVSTGLLYADDTIVYSNHEYPLVALQHLEKHIGVINDYYNTWGIKLNVPKSELICIRNASGKGPIGVVRESKHLTLNVNGCPIQVQNKLKYLGINFNNLFKFNYHAKLTIEKTRKVSNMLMPFFRHRALNKKSKLLFYKTLVRPVMTYGFPIWFNISPSVAQNMEILERKLLRLCAGKNFETRTKRFSNNFIYSDTNTVPLMRYVSLLMKKTISNFEQSENDLIIHSLASPTGSSWDGVGYLSPLGILSVDLDAPVLEPLEFYNRAIPNQNRG